MSSMYAYYLQKTMERSSEINIGVIPKLYSSEHKDNNLLAFVVLHPSAEKIFSSTNSLIFYLQGLIHKSYIENGLNYAAFNDLKRLFSDVYENIYDFNEYRTIIKRDSNFRKYITNIDNLNASLQKIYISMFLPKVNSLEQHMNDYENIAKEDNITFDEWSNNWRSGIIVYEFEERELFMNVNKMQLVLLEFLKIFDKKSYY